MNYILPASDATATEEDVGGKAASLVRLVALGMAVPEFFIVPTRAFREMEETDFSSEFLAQLREAYRALGDDVPVAVRSSATAEDDPDASHAGIYETKLDVRGFDALVEAIRACWGSYRSAVAEQYRRDRAVADGGAMAVVVQRFVPADWSGVCFTADPVRQLLTRGILNATPGIGEALVSGTVTPEEILLEPASGAIERRTPGAHAAPLPDALVQDVWRQCQSIADTLGFPQDIEWAAIDGSVQILQSRPITTVAALWHNRELEPWRDTPEVAEDPERIWSRAYGDEIWSSPTSPLFYQVQNLSASFSSWRELHHDPTPLPSAVFKYYRAAAYVDVETLKRSYEYHPQFARLEGVLNFFPRSMRTEVKEAPFRWWGRLRRHLHFELQDRQQRSIRLNHRYLDTLWPDFMETSDRWFDLDLDALSLDELRTHQDEVMGEFGRVGAPCAYAVMYHAHDLTFGLTGLLERWLGDGPSRYAEVSSGLEGSAAVQEADQIWRLAELTRAAGDEAIDQVQKASPESLNSLAGQNANLLQFVDAFWDFWRAHRHRGASYKDLVYPRWGEEPRLLLDLVKGYLNGTALRPLDRNKQQASMRRDAQEAVLRRLRGPLSPLRRAVLKWLMRYNEIYMRVRDDHRFYFDRNWYQLRRIYRSYGRRLAERGLLAEGDDIFFLGAEEIEQGLGGDLEADLARARIEIRRREWQETLRHQAPKFLRGYAPLPDDEPGAADAASDSDPLIQGIGASPGFAVGRARVARTIEELSDLEDGEILVTRQTDPGWTPVFPRLGGLVLETGGALAHGTSLCREYGLPCVTAVERAQDRIPDGARIEIDGAVGTIRLLEAVPR